MHESSINILIICSTVLLLFIGMGIFQAVGDSGLFGYWKTKQKVKAENYEKNNSLKLEQRK